MKAPQPIPSGPQLRRRAEGDEYLVFALPDYAPMADQLVAAPDFEHGRVSRATFPDGERYLRIDSDVSGRDVVLLGGTLSDAATLELFDLGSAAVKYGARRLTLVIPYFGYATMERAVRPGEVVTAKSRARLFSAIPAGSDPARVLLVDLHSEGIPHYFEGAVRPVHLYAKPVIEQAIVDLAEGQEVVLASTDAGRAKWVESLANDLGLQAAFVLKRRLSGDKTEVVAMSAHVEGRHVIIYDDMIRTGGSLIEAAKAYRQAGAVRVSAVATHGVFPDQALRRLEASGVIDRIACTDTHPRARELAGAYLTVKPIAGLLASYLRTHP